MSKIVTGKELRHDLLNLELTRKPIVDELLYERDIFLLTSDAGAGKSIFATQLAACLSFKRPFLSLDIPEAKKVLYIQLEGDYEESVERLRVMESEGGIIIEENNLLWIEEKTLNVLDSGSVQGFFKRINDTGFIPDVVIVDPIYKLCDDISKGSSALGVIRFSDKLANKWNCSIVLVHHNLKESYTEKGEKVRKDDSYYGHSFIKNHIRTSYAFVITGENTRDLIRKKGRGSDTRRKMSLEYNPETFCLSLASSTPTHKRGRHIDRFYTFLADVQSRKVNTTGEEIMRECELTYMQLRVLKNKPETMALFNLKKMAPNNREIWFPI